MKKRKTRRVKKTTAGKKRAFDPYAYNKKYRVVQKLLDDLDVTATFNQLQENLSMDTRKMSRSELLEVIDRASTLRWRAGLLYLTAKQERTRIEMFFHRKMGDWEIQARRELAKMKSKKEGNEAIEGQVTTSLVENYLARHFSEYRKLKNQVSIAKRNEGLFEILSETWKSRTSLLQTASKLVEVKVVPGKALPD